MSYITLGIIGSGQLGSLLCQAAKKLNIKTVVISDDKEGPAQNYADQFIFSQYDNQEKVKQIRFLRGRGIDLFIIQKILSGKSFEYI